MKVLCYSCGSVVYLSDESDVGDLVDCPSCGAELELVRKGNRLDASLVERDWVLDSFDESGWEESEG